MTAYPVGFFSECGDISATLTSPEGSTSIILFNRPYDIVTEGYDNWPLLSVLHWGENPQGQWTLQVNWRNSAGYANVSGVSVTLYGTATIPQSVASIPDECSPSCARSKGCAAAGAEFCDACNSTLLRNATTLECISPDECTASIASGYCYEPRLIPSSKPTSSTLGTVPYPTATSSILSSTLGTSTYTCTNLSPTSVPSKSSFRYTNTILFLTAAFVSIVLT